MSSEPERYETPKNSIDNERLVREYGPDRKFTVELTGSGFVKIATPNGKWTKVSFQSFVALSEDITGVIQGNSDD
jgi:hypothetical protein